MNDKMRLRIINEKYDIECEKMRLKIEQLIEETNRWRNFNDKTLDSNYPLGST